MNRLHVPTSVVPAGIDPMASPGGWRLIGRMAMPLFDRGAAPPALLRMCDRIRFVPAREAAR
jgi:allophanate hydrolase subunit 1